MSTTCRTSRSPVVVAARTLALLVMAAMAAGACGLGEKQALADRVHESRDKYREAGAVSAQILFEVTLDEDAITEDEARDNPLLQQQRRTGSFGFPALVRLEHADGENAALWVPRIPEREEPAEGEAALDAVLGGGEGGPDAGQQPEPGAAAQAQQPPEDAEGPAEQSQGQQVETNAVFLDETIYVRRTNLRETERRIWARLNYARLPEEETRPSENDIRGPLGLIAAIHTINPHYIADWVAGALAGSMQVAGPSKVGEIETTKYNANVSIDKVYQDLELDDAEIETRQLMMRLLAVSGDVFPAEFDIDENGVVRRFKIDFQQNISRLVQNEFSVTFTVLHLGPDGGPPIQLIRPTSDETLGLERYGRLVRTVLPQT